MGSKNSNRWYEKGFWQPPQLVRGIDANNMDYEKERDMAWTELFFDLVFVTSVTKVGDGR